MSTGDFSSYNFVKVQVPNDRAPAQSLHYNAKYQNAKFPIIRYMDPLTLNSYIYIYIHHPHVSLNPKPLKGPNNKVHGPFRLDTLSNSWIIIILWIYIYRALNRTPNIVCYWVGAVPNPSGVTLNLQVAVEAQGRC